MKTKKTMCAIRPGLGLAKSSKNPTPENVKKTAYKNCNLASHLILSQILPELVKYVRRMLSAS
jgi:hypothetical protein